MASIDWPSTLPKPLSDSYVATPPDGSISTQMDSGPVKKRRRYTAAPRLFSLSFLLTSSQRTTLDTFWLITTRMGTLRFNFAHPITGVVAESRLKGPPSYANPVAQTVQAVVTIEVLP